MLWWQRLKKRFERPRRAPRYLYRVPVEARCSAWPSAITAHTLDVASGGLFLQTNQLARIGDAIELGFALPGSDPFFLRGKVVSFVDAERAAALSRAAGIGVEFDPLDPTAEGLYSRILERARSEEPVPPPEATPRASGNQKSRLASVAPLEVAKVKPPASPTQRTELPTAAPPSVAPRRQSRSGPIVGIDLGTSYTSVAAAVENKVRVLPSKDGSCSIPSAIYFPRDGGIVVGAAARLKMASDPSRCVISPKRLLGRNYSDAEVQTFTARLAFRSFAGPDGATALEIGGNQYAVTQLISYIFKDALAVAEEQLGQRVDQAVVSVPVSFDERRTTALLRAAEMAGLEVVAVLDEPSAAALSNRFTPQFGGVVGVYDFGGGTFDFTLVDVSGGAFEVLTTAGDTWLGGDDVDNVLASAAADQFWRQHKVDLRNQAVEWQRLLFAVEKAKRELGTAEESVIQVPEVLRTAEGMVDLRISLNRAILDRACSAIIERSLETCDQALSLFDMKPGDLNAVFLSGGTTYLAAVREALARHFGVPVCTGVPPEHAVCLGTAIHAAQIERRARLTLGDAR